MLRTWDKFRARWVQRVMLGVSLIVGVGVLTATQPVKPVVQPTSLASPCGESLTQAAVTGSQIVRVPLKNLGAIPCNDTTVLPKPFRAQVECTLRRLDKGGWSPQVFETYRSNQRQQFLYSFGRTRPGSRVTNAQNVYTSVHGYYLAVDIIDRKKGWDNPRFFTWVGRHAESCGLTSGAFWKKFPDQPHVQTGKWEGAPPKWAQELSKKDSVSMVLRRLDEL